jgi:hypothetical protein
MRLTEDDLNQMYADVTVQYHYKEAFLKECIWALQQFAAPQDTAADTGKVSTSADNVDGSI